MKLLLMQGVAGEGEELAAKLEDESVQTEVVTIAGEATEAKKHLVEKIDSFGADGVVLLVDGGTNPEKLIGILHRECELPVIAAGSADEARYYEEVRCFEAGADDYVPRHTPAPVIILRFQRLFHIYKGIAGACHYHRGLVELVDEKDYLWQGRFLGLTATEYHVLRLLLHSTGKVVAKERLMEQVWQREATGESWVLTTIIKKLRKKLEAVPVEIVNCYGKGYRLTTGYAI